MTNAETEISYSKLLNEAAEKLGIKDLYTLFRRAAAELPDISNEVRDQVAEVGYDRFKKDGKVPPYVSNFALSVVAPIKEEP